MSGEKDIKKLIKSMSPELRDGDFVFHTAAGSYGDFSELNPAAFFAEAEGITLVIPKALAEGAGIDCSSTFRCITLNIHSSLDAVGLTAAVSAKLTEEGISANVIAAYYHDHIFVQSADADRAIAALIDLTWKN